MATGHSVAVPGRKKLMVPEELEAYLNREIKGQEIVTKSLAQAVARAENGLSRKGNFLLLGPTGVGKTEMTMALARYLYKADPEERVGHFTQSQSPEKWGPCIDYISSLGGGILHLDQIDIFDRDLLLEALSSHRISLPNGEIMDLSHFYLVVTLNCVEVYPDVLLRAKTFFGRDVFSHFTENLVFNPLTYETQIALCRKFLDKEILHVQKAVGRPVRLQEEVFPYLIERGFSPALGARPLRCCIEKEIQKCVFNWQIDRGHINRVVDPRPLEMRVGERTQLILAEVT